MGIYSLKIWEINPLNGTKTLECDYQDSTNSRTSRNVYDIVYRDRALINQDVLVVLYCDGICERAFRYDPKKPF